MSTKDIYLRNVDTELLEQQRKILSLLIDDQIDISDPVVIEDLKGIRNLLDSMSDGDWVLPKRGFMSVELDSGRTTQVTVHPKTGQIIVDVAIQDKDGDWSGNECVRMNLNEVDLSHVEVEGE